jgi:hypothetical protein
MTSRRRGHRANAQSLIETVVGIIFLVPIVLFLFDVGVLVLANTANDNLAKQAARAAAGAAPAGNLDPSDPANIGLFQTAAIAAAQKVVDNFAAGRSAGYLTDIKLAKVWYVGAAPTFPSVVAQSAFPPPSGDVAPGAGNCAVFTRIICVAPVPFPGFDTQRTFFAKAVEPIVSLPPIPDP